MELKWNTINQLCSRGLPSFAFFYSKGEKNKVLLLVHYFCLMHKISN